MMFTGLAKLVAMLGVVAFVWSCAAPRETVEDSGVVDEGATGDQVDDADESEFEEEDETVVVATVGASAGALELEFVDVGPGLEFFGGNVSFGDSVAEAFLVRAVDVVQIDIVASADARASGNSLDYFAQEYGAPITLSGGYLRSFAPVIPLGLVVVDGRTINPLVSDPFLDGVIVTTADGVAIGYGDAVPLEAVEDGLQSGPVLVVDGESVVGENLEQNLSEAERSSILGPSGRAFVALDGVGQRLVGVTGAVSLIALAEFLATSTEHGGLSVVAALNLSGGVTRGLVVDTPGFRNAYYNTDRRIATALLLK